MEELHQLNSCWQNIYSFEEADPNLSMIQTIIAGDSPELIASQISRGADIEYQDSNGNTPLALAVRERRLATVRFLLEQGANPNPHLHKSLLAQAIELGEVSIAQTLVDHGIKVDVYASPRDGGDGGEPFVPSYLWIVIYKHIESERRRNRAALPEWRDLAYGMIERGAPFVPDLMMDSIMMDASRNKDYRLTRLILERGLIDPNARLKIDWPPEPFVAETYFMRAITLIDPTLIKLLVEFGADVNLGIQFVHQPHLRYLPPLPTKTPLSEAQRVLESMKFSPKKYHDKVQASIERARLQKLEAQAQEIVNYLLKQGATLEGHRFFIHVR